MSFWRRNRDRERDMKEELESMFERPIDLLTRASIETMDNSIRRKSILASARIIFDAQSTHG